MYTEWDYFLWFVATDSGKIVISLFVYLLVDKIAKAHIEYSAQQEVV